MPRRVPIDSSTLVLRLCVTLPASLSSGSASTDVDDLRGLHKRQEVLVAELQHRTRNLMSVIRSIADNTAQTSENLAAFTERFKDRLEAPARVQGLLSRLNEHDRVTIDDLIRGELGAMDGAAERVSLEGIFACRWRWQR